jgi:hypothetical protein
VVLPLATVADSLRQTPPDPSGYPAFRGSRLQIEFTPQPIVVLLLQEQINSPDDGSSDALLEGSAHVGISHQSSGLSIPTQTPQG